MGGCAQSLSAAWVSARYLVQPDSAPTLTPNPAYRYMKVSANGKDAFLVLGYIDRDAVTGKPVEVWYSADKEALRLNDGRLVGLASTPMEWYVMRLPADMPSWREINGPVDYQRERDEMPGYRIGVLDKIQLRPTAAPQQSRLTGYSPSQLSWFEEVGGEHGRALFAIQNGRPVYGEQCLSSSLCLTWQPWPPQPPAP